MCSRLQDHCFAPCSHNPLLFSREESSISSERRRDKNTTIERKYWKNSLAVIKRTQGSWLLPVSHYQKSPSSAPVDTVVSAARTLRDSLPEPKRVSWSGYWRRAPRARRLPGRHRYSHFLPYQDGVQYRVSRRGPEYSTPVRMQYAQR